MKGFVGIYILIALIIIGAVVAGTKHLKQFKEFKPTASNTADDKKTELKTYKNDYYHIKLDIPSDWNIEEEKTQTTSSNFKLSSPNKEIVLQSGMPNEKDFLNTNPFKEKDVEIGEYKAAREQYRDNNNQIIEYVDLYSVRQQKSVILSFTVGGNFDINNKKLLEILKTFSYTQKEPSLDEFISYTLPKGWTKDSEVGTNSDPDKNIFLHSPGNDLRPGPFIEEGAWMDFDRYESDPKITLKEQLSINSNPTFPTLIKIDGLDTYNAFHCYEGCSDIYYVEKGAYTWQIEFGCVLCSTKSETDKNKFARDRDAFLNSIKFK
ncbi:MAG TPA: PsbP-related protein [Candidatus Saccharimonadales bacterium]|nr:PsbP-related protein [Candidatus Saccharimonadales bacterium]